MVASDLLTLIHNNIHVNFRHCIATPSDGGRLLQTGDDEIFKLCNNRKGELSPYLSLAFIYIM